MVVVVNIVNVHIFPLYTQVIYLIIRITTYIMKSRVELFCDLLVALIKSRGAVQIL